MTKRVITFITVLVLLTISCDRVKNKTKETINKGGETVGKTASEFFEGVSEGVEKTLQCELVLSEELKEKGLKTGKYSVESDMGNNNKLILYLIFDKDFESVLTAKAYDKNGLEIGRTELNVESKANQAGYYDFLFDKRTHIEVKSKIIIEQSKNR